MLVCHGLFGEPIQNELVEVQQFSIANPDEIIILSISHETDDGITGTLNTTLADLIATTLTGMLIRPPVRVGRITIPGFGPSSTLSEVWQQTGRIIVLYDDDALTELKTSGDSNWEYFWDANNYYTPYPDLDGTYVGSKGRIYWDQNMAMGPASTPTDNPENLNELPAVKQNLTCGKHPTNACPSIGTSDSGTTEALFGVPQLFALQTQPTPENSLVYANVFDQIVNDTGVQAAIYACDVGSFGACSDLEDDIRKALGFPFSPYPTNLQALGEDGNNVILQNITSWITDTPALRQNLNIVLADHFESMYEAPGPSGTTVQSNFIDSMLKLNEPPQSTLSIGVPQYGCPTNCFVTSSTPFFIFATDSNWGVSSIDYEYVGPTGQVVWPNPVPDAVWKFDIAAPAVDGPYKVYYWATNGAGLWGGPNPADSAAVTLDNTPPVITIVQPAAVRYPHWATLTLNYSANDGTGSGVASVTATIDGMSTVGGQVLASGKAINLENLSLGTHVFTVTATDHVGNTSTSSVTFSLITTPVDCSVVAPEVLVNGQKEFTITATVTPDPPASVFPTGKVQIWDAAFNVHIIPDPTLINGVASVTVELAPTPTTQWIMSIYPGDTNFKGCQSQFAPARWVF